MLFHAKIVVKINPAKLKELSQSMSAILKLTGDDTSRVTRIALLGRLPRLESLLRKSVVSLICESKVETRGLM